MAKRTVLSLWRKYVTWGDDYNIDPAKLKACMSRDLREAKATRASRDLLREIRSDQAWYGRQAH